jgi:DnaA family protein
MSAPHQLLLNLKLDWIPSLDNYVAGNNQQLLRHLQGLARPAGSEAIYLWGSEGCGKSHLSRAVADLAKAHRPLLDLNGLAFPPEADIETNGLIVVDDVQHLSADAQVGLFRLFVRARHEGLALLLTGPVPPLELTLREDLRTRIGQGLIYEIQNLSDEEKQAALQRHAALRGMRLESNVVHYLLRYGRRDLPSLMAMLDSLDRTSLEQKRQASVPMLRELMQTTLELHSK